MPVEIVPSVSNFKGAVAEKIHALFDDSAKIPVI